MSLKNGPHLPHYHNAIKSTNTSAVYTPSTSIVSEPLTNNYTIGENIGRGKFAVVRKCTNKHTGEIVAAKFIKKRRRGKSCREEILREVVMLEMALDHPRLVNLKEVYETQQELILITEYCAGGELFTECILEEKFDEADVRLLMSQILEGLVYLHEKNIVHLDLKPQNILLTDEFPRGSVKICDLGFACLVNTGEDIRDIIGTPDYVAPEVLNYDPLGLYTDMWSLGVLTYVMLTTCSPFAAEDKQMTFSNITNVILDFPEDLFADISLAAQDFIQKLLVAEPGERMTAKECFSHEWIAGITKPAKPLTICASEPTDLKVDVEEDSDAEEKNDLSDRDLEKDDNDLCEKDLDKEETSIKHSRESSREKIEDQQSEMSVSEAREDEGVELDAELDEEAHVQLELSSNVSEEVIKDRSIQNIDISPVKSITENFPIEAETGRLENKISTVNANIVSSSDVTPDTDSSMCISDTRLQDIDSGMFTGSECKSTESVNISGRTSVDQEPTSVLDTDFISETTGDTEMMNESLIESEISKNVKEEEVNVSTNLSEGTDHRQNVSTNLSADTEHREREMSEVNAENTEEIQEVTSDNEMDIEISDSHKDNVSLDTNENNSAQETKFENRHNRLEGNSSFRQDGTIGSKFSGYPADKVFSSEMTSSVYAPAQSQCDTRAHNSVSNIDDSVNSMQLGERHKRGMCNEPVTPGTGNAENEEEEYEFVSVSKRVKSYEDTLAHTKSPPYSPKISKSPRIARHARHHQHH